MNVFLRLELECSPEAAWRGIRNPAMLIAASKPLIHIRTHGRVPGQWQDNTSAEVSLWMFGLIPLGRRTIDVSLSERPGGVRMLIDQGEARTGPMQLMKDWDHRMAVSPGSGNKTLYRDRLVVRAGVFTFPVWLGLWFTWKYRSRRIAKLARDWK